MARLCWSLCALACRCRSESLFARLSLPLARGAAARESLLARLSLAFLCARLSLPLARGPLALAAVLDK